MIWSSFRRIGLILTLVLGIAATGLGCGSRHLVGRRPVAELAGIDADSLLACITNGELITGWEGKGTLRLHVEGRDLPALSLRCDLRDTCEVKGSARPGMFSPVFAFWGDSLGWQLRLPRSRALLTTTEQVGEWPGAAAEGLTGRRLVRLFWYGFVPAALIAELANPRVYVSGEDWIIRGHPRELGVEISAAEVRVDRETLAVRRWDLSQRDGKTLVQVLYSPPVLKTVKEDRAPDLIQFVCPSLELTGGLKVTKFNPPPAMPFRKPSPPEGWSWFTGERLGELLEAVFAEER